MPAATTVVLADAQATPVNHTFTPVAKGANGEFIFEDQSGSHPLFYPKLTLRLQKSTSVELTSVNRVNFTLSLPEQDTSSVSPKVLNVTRVKGEIIVPITASTQKRLDIMKYAAGVLQNAGLFIPMVRDGANIF